MCKGKGESCLQRAGKLRCVQQLAHHTLEMQYRLGSDLKHLLRGNFSEA